MKPRLTPPTVPVIYSACGLRRSTQRAVREWLLFLCTPIGMRE